MEQDREARHQPSLPGLGSWSAPKRRRLLFGAGGLVLGGGAASALWLHQATSASADPEPEAPSESVEPAVAAAAVAEIKQVKARCFRAVDTKDWELLKAQLTDDVVVDTTGSGGPVLVGSEAFIAFLQLTLSPAVTVHHARIASLKLTRVHMDPIGQQQTFGM